MSGFRTGTVQSLARETRAHDRLYSHIHRRVLLTVPEYSEMTTKRKEYTENEHSVLYSETKGCCPLCSHPILFRKNARLNKGYEVAHIYPLNPTPAQCLALNGHPPPDDINALENVIALCPSCHRQYDKEFDVAEMLALRALKDAFLADAAARVTASQYILQEQVFSILDSIIALSDDDLQIGEPQFDVATVDKKLRTGMSPLQKREIKSNAAIYYVRIRHHIRMLEQRDQHAVRILQAQIKTYCLEMQKRHPDNKDVVFSFIAQWISDRTMKPLLAARILTSFFVQNCEVFDVGSE